MKMCQKRSKLTIAILRRKANGHNLWRNLLRHDVIIRGKAAVRTPSLGRRRIELVDDLRRTKKMLVCTERGIQHQEVMGYVC